MEAVDSLEQEKEAITVGIVRDGKVLINPTKEEKLQPDEELLQVAKRKLNPETET